MVDLSVSLGSTIKISFHDKNNLIFESKSFITNVDSIHSSGGFVRYMCVHNLKNKVVFLVSDGFGIVCTSHNGIHISKSRNLLIEKNSIKNEF